MDLMSKLPDEILMEVLAPLPSLRDKLRVEGVSRRFQSCLFKLLNTKPLPFKWAGLDGHLNGYKVHEGQLEEVVQMLAKKAKFESVLINCASTDELDGILASVANSRNDCLVKVHSFHVTRDEMRFRIAHGRLPHFGRYLLAPVVAKCAKLTTLKLDLYVSPLKSKEDLGVSIAGRALTELNICLEGHTQQQIVELYQSLKPNTLKKIQLCLRDTTLDSVDAFVTDLAGDAWLALEEIDLDLHRVRLHMDQLFPSLCRLPKLRKCYITMAEINPENQLVDILNSLFASRIQMTLGATGSGSGCQTVALIRQVQAVHPDLQVGFGADGQRLKLTLDKVSFEHFSTSTLRWSRPCADADCADCGLLYPTVIRKLLRRAWRRMRGVQEVHLANCRLDRCRVQRAVADLNAMAQFTKSDHLLTAVSAELNEAGDLLTVTFEAVWPMYENIQEQVQITVDCGHCLSFGCPGCIEI